MVRIGIIGMGMMGLQHYEAYQKISGAQVAAICDADPQRASGDMSANWSNMGGSQVKQLPMDRIGGYTDVKKMLAEGEIDAVDICLPTPFHVDVALPSLAAGKHVICEKPLGRTLAEAKIMADAAEKARGIFMPAMCIRFWPSWAWLKGAMAGGEYGKLRALTIRRIGAMPPGWFEKGDWSGGAMMDLHIHDTDFVYFLLGMPSGVFSSGHTIKSGRIDHVITHYLYPGGPMVVAEGGWAVEPGIGFSMRYSAHFEKATVDFDSSRGEQAMVLARGAEKTVMDLPGDGYTAELQYFVDCISAGRKPLIVTAADALASIRIAEAEIRSAECGAVVKL